MEQDTGGEWSSRGGDDHQGAGGGPVKRGAARGPFRQTSEKNNEDDLSAPWPFAAALIATPAAAADLYGRRPGPAYAAAPFSGYNWNGVYVGVNLGYQWGKVTNWGTDRAERRDGRRPDRRTTGSSAQWVLGLEADIQGSGANDTFAAYKFSNPWFGTVRGRAGYAMNNVLLYVTGGLAYGGGTRRFRPSSASRRRISAGPSAAASRSA